MAIPKKSKTKPLGNKLIKASIAFGEGQSSAKAAKVLKQGANQVAGKKGKK